MLARVYIVVTDAAGSVVARRYLSRDEIPSWLGTKIRAAGDRCDVYDDAPVCGGRVLTTFISHAGTWREG